MLRRKIAIAMVNTTTKIEELFSTFHDFIIVGLNRVDGDLLVTFNLPWGEMWGKKDFILLILLKDCKRIKCNYFEYLYDENRSGNNEIASKSTINPDKITTLGLDIQRFKRINNEEYKFYCNGFNLDNNIGGGEIILTASDFKIMNIDKKEIHLDKYKSWFDQWCKFIDANE